MDEPIRTILGVLDDFLRPEPDEKQRRKRAGILAAATECFVTHGYRKTSVEDIARRAGIAKGTVYLYYASKAELLFHAVGLEKETYLAQLASLRALSHTPYDRLRGIVAIGLIMSRRMPLMRRLTRGDRELELGLADVDKSLLEYLNEQQISMMVELIEDATEQAIPRAELRKRAQILADLMYALATSSRLTGTGAELESHARMLADVMVAGIVHGSGARRWSRGIVQAVRESVADG